ncbi:MAG: M28 family peptidase [Bacillati bacterium ANGP1]|uniref:M28 family peptidase n=1 Tax=Candidatus Segetimicrobium genomatis TaxID=2569760 RepID=A0A537J8Y0_9BACT|nr:MAG: M28 family peptidase [Terrabacteria group bacterium ANGP1]
MIDLDAVSRTRLWEHNQAIARWTRLSGSTEERHAAEYAADQLRGFGLATRILTHDAFISLPLSASLRLVRPQPLEISCITHSMGIPTPREGVAAELVYAGPGMLDDYVRAGAAGKMALVEGRATPQHAVNATRAGALGLICISGRHAHEMCCSPIWGNPSADTVAGLPRVHLLSVPKADGEALRGLCQRGRVEVQFTAAVRSAWTKTPIVLADLSPGHPEAEAGMFVLFSGHLDGWYAGAMDNGSANAAMLEVTRLLALHRERLRRGVRVAMWSGHSHGRYSSSTWYADTHWFDLADHCLAHVNIDSVGAMDADEFVTNSMPETAGLGVWAVRQAAGATLIPKRVGRNSDQSFLGIGIPSILGSVSHQADGTLGWWWHTPHDTLDKIDPERLLRDAKIFVRTLERLLTDPVLPLDYEASARDVRQSLEALAKDVGGAFDLGPAVAAAATLEEQCTHLARVASAATPSQARTLNACLVSLGRILIPATYTARGQYAHDPALETEFLPTLRHARRLAGLAPDSDEARLAGVDLVRGRNAIVDALRRAQRRVESCLAELGRTG